MKGMLRPEVTILPADALIPKENRVSPPPNRFTHRLRRATPFYFGRSRAGKPNGELAAGSKVALMVHNGGATCRVIDERGLYVTVAFASLVPL